MPKRSESPKAEVLTSEQRAESKARMIFDKHPNTSLPKLLSILREQVTDPTERNQVLGCLIRLSRESMREYLKGAEAEPSEILARVNEELDPRTGKALKKLRKVS